jgi:predicted DNA-binding transcriptional regulator YafY
MPREDRMEPLERLLNLVGLLLESRGPRTFDEIREVLEPYRQENVDSAKRMFERDKDLLREFGVPLELVDVDAWGGEQGYVIRKERYYLPEIAFTPQELGALFVAAQSGSEDTTPAEQAVRKLLTGVEGGGILAMAGGGPLASGSDARSPLVVGAADAAERRRRVRFGYRTSSGEGSERTVDAYAVVFRRGHWYLVGFDHGRDDVRAFRLSRLTTDLTDVGEGSEPPEGFRATEHVQPGPWSPAPEDRATIAFAPEVAWWAASAQAGAEVSDPRADGWVEVTVAFGDETSVADWVLTFGPQAEVLAPASLRAAVIERLERVGA